MRSLKLKKLLYWIFAIVITLGAARYQRATGPTYPMSGTFIMANGTETEYSFTRSHGGDGDQEVRFDPRGEEMDVVLRYKRFNINEEMTEIKMIPGEDGVLTAFLPHQPPAGKLEYMLMIYEGDKVSHLPDFETVVTRFKGDVPVSVLIPHILFMFLAMLISSRAGIEALDRNGESRTLTYLTASFLFIGGMVLGPIVQKYAFGEYWTGVPWGWDLTDNKTLVAMIGWGTAAWAHYSSRPNARYYVITAALILFAVYLIPHSVMGSELDYETGEVMTGSLLLAPALILFRRS